MKRILLTYTLAFALLPVYAGEGGSPPTNKNLLIDYVDPFIGLQISELPIQVQSVRMV